MNREFLIKRDKLGSLNRDDIRAFRIEMLVSYAAICITLIASVAFLEDSARSIYLFGQTEWRSAVEAFVGRGLLSFFILTGLVYQINRLGYLKRVSTHRAASKSELEQIYNSQAHDLAILIPTYKEEPHVVRQTLLAAALQQSPNRRIVLLIDDPPISGDADTEVKLAAARNLPREINTLFAGPERKFETELAGFIRRNKESLIDRPQEVVHVAELLHDAADWLDKIAEETVMTTHTDRFFVERILRAPAHSHRSRARALTGQDPASIDLLLEYRRLATLFKVEVTSFERKRYVNLSHEANKAMNLNSYIALMGNNFREIASPDGHILEETTEARATLRVPKADFIVVLDADSLILPEYLLRLIHFMTQPGNERVAVVQTPYASVPGAATMIERVAGATTDVQLMSHQGTTQYGAGSWVGASALVRRVALDDIRFTQKERGYPISSFIRDRTLNEDTDTTVDLIRKNWIVHNYPDRLAYSATPSDFGSLLIQRRRWATGGLIIMANLFRHFLDQPSFRRLWEVLIRSQYILSAPVGCIGALILICYPFKPDTIWSIWPLLAFLALIAVFRRDLMHCGNRGPDLLRAISLNAMLLPINLAGTIKSVQQLWTGRKIAFQRTPKVNERTAATPVHIAAQFGLLLFAGLQVPVQLIAGEQLRSLFFMIYAVLFGYAMHVFIGWRAAIEDAIGGLYAKPLVLSKLPWGESTEHKEWRTDLKKTGNQCASLWHLLFFAAYCRRNSWRFVVTVCTCLLVLSLSASAAHGNPGPEHRMVAVSFDDLPVISVTQLNSAARRDITKKLLGNIKSNKVPAIGFVNEYELYGFSKVPKGPPDKDGIALLQMWLDDGLELGNHTFAHVDLHAIPIAAFKEDVIRGETETSRLLKQKGKRLRYFRYPYLHTGQDIKTKHTVEKFLADRGYRLAPVTVDNEDYMFAAAYSKAAESGDKPMMRRIGAEYIDYTERIFQYNEKLSVTLFGREIRQILLLHANALNADFFGNLAQMIKKRGYSFISLDEALKDNAYSSPDTYTGDESINWLARWAITRGVKNIDNIYDDLPDVPDFVKKAAAPLN
jgi:cellulose synthase (UDP-forming)